MRASAYEDVKKALILDKDLIGRIWTLVGLCGENQTAEAKCADGITRHFESLEELQGYENSRRHRILDIVFRSELAESNSRAVVNLDRSRTRFFSLEAESEKSVSDIRQGLLDVFDDAKAWYSIAALNSPATLVLLVSILLGLLLGLRLLPDEPGPSVPVAHLLPLFALVIADMIVAGCATLVVELLRRRFFPILSIAVGQGSSRHIHAEKIRWLLVSLTAGAIVSAVTYGVSLIVHTKTQASAPLARPSSVPKP